MNEVLAIFVVSFFFALRFGLPLALILGSGYLANRWLERQIGQEQLVK